MFNRKPQINIIIVLILLIALFSSCSKNDKNQQYNIPHVNVDFYVQPYTIDYMPVGSWKSYDEEGYRGVIIYHLIEGNFIAYERCCPFDPQKDDTRVEVDQSGFILIDSICMSQFGILDGMPISGPSTLPLKQYQTEYDPFSKLLHVYNNQY